MASGWEEFIKELPLGALLLAIGVGLVFLLFGILTIWAGYHGILAEQAIFGYVIISVGVVMIALSPTTYLSYRKIRRKLEQVGPE